LDSRRTDPDGSATAEASKFSFGHDQEGSANADKDQRYAQHYGAQDDKECAVQILPLPQIDQEQYRDRDAKTDQARAQQSASPGHLVGEGSWIVGNDKLGYRTRTHSATG
jgi:hypothetical protein